MMCQFMGLPAFAPDALLRFQLRTALKRITSDDKDILWEGVHSLNEDELRQVTPTRTRALTRALTRSLTLTLTLSSARPCARAAYPRWVSTRRSCARRSVRGSSSRSARRSPPTRP